VYSSCFYLITLFGSKKMKTVVFWTRSIMIALHFFCFVILEKWKKILSRVSNRITDYLSSVIIQVWNNIEEEEENDQHHSFSKTISQRKRKKSRKANQAKSSINTNISYRFGLKKISFLDIFQLVTCNLIENKTTYLE
jgi:hypothetical protein